MSSCPGPPLQGWRLARLELDIRNHPVVQADDHAARVLAVIFADCRGRSDSGAGKARLVKETELPASIVEAAIAMLGQKPFGPIHVVKDPSVLARRRFVLRDHPGAEDCLRSLSQRAVVTQLNPWIAKYSKLGPS